MTLNILFFTITIKRRKVIKEDVHHHENIHRIYEEVQERQDSIQRFF